MKFFNFNRTKKVKKSKKFGAILFVFMIFVSCFYGRLDMNFVFVQNVAYAEEAEESLAEELAEEVENQLSNLDFSEIESVLSALGDKTQNLFSSSSFSAKVSAVLTGEYVDSSENFFSSVVSLLFSDLKSFLPLIASVISISILGGMVSNLKPTSSGKSLGGVIHFVTYGLVIVILGTSLVSIVTVTTSTLTSVKGIFDALFPILLTLLTAIGGTTSVAVYQPAIAILSEVISGFFTYALLPIFIFSVVFSLVGNLSNNVKLDKFVSFLQGLFKWSVGLCFTIFLGFVSIQGVLAGSVDGLSIRTAKYAIKSYIPIVGSYVSDGLSIITASTALIKNAVGGVGLFLLLSSMISPVFSLVIFMLSLKFMAGVIEPIGDSKTANFISDLSKSLTLLIALLVATAFMYVVMSGLIMMSANSVLGI